MIDLCPLLGELTLWSGNGFSLRWHFASGGVSRLVFLHNVLCCRTRLAPATMSVQVDFSAYELLIY